MGSLIKLAIFLSKKKKKYRFNNGPDMFYSKIFYEMNATILNLSAI